MATSTTKTFLLGGCVLLGAWGISSLIKNEPKTLPPAHTEREAISWNPLTYEDPYGSKTYDSTRENARLKQSRGNSRQYASNYSPARGKYHYEITITDARREWETYEKETLINGEIRLRKTSPDISQVNGTYIWDMDEYLPDEDAMFNYILSNYPRMRKYKVNPTSRRKNDADEFNDRLDEYLADPEDESEFPPQIFDFLDD